MRTFAIATLASLSSATAFDAAKHLFSRSVASPSTNTEGGSVSLAPGYDGGSTYQYVGDECYDSANNPVIFKASDGKNWIQSNQTSTDWSGTNNDGQNLLTGANDNTNWYFDIYDVYFNGSIWLKLDPPSGAACEGVQTTTQPYSYLRIGQMSRSGGKYDRSTYDSNPFYFRLGRMTGADNKCQFTPRKLFTSMESSNNGLDKNVAWTLKSTKSDDVWHISGEVTASTASNNNYFNVLPFASSNTTNDPNCPSHFHAATLMKDSGLTMNGTISEKDASIMWYFTDPTSGWSVTGSFNGTVWANGADMDMKSSSDTIATIGSAKRVGSSGSDDSDESFVEKHEKGIISGAVVFGVVILAAIAAAAFFLWRRRQAARKPYKEAHQVDHDDAWAMEDQHEERDLKDTATGLKPMPSSANLLSNVDTSYNAHRAPSPDPSGLPAYSDSYTPLKH